VARGRARASAQRAQRARVLTRATTPRPPETPQLTGVWTLPVRVAAALAATMSPVTLAQRSLAAPRNRRTALDVTAHRPPVALVQRSPAVPRNRRAALDVTAHRPPAAPEWRRVAAIVPWTRRLRPAPSWHLTPAVPAAAVRGRARPSVP